MKDFAGEIQYKDKTYRLTFNLNVMEAIQEKYGTVEKWGELTDGSGEKGEPDAKAIIFGFREMLNEAIDIDNEENGADVEPMTLKQVGRLVTEIGLEKVTTKINDTVIESTQSEEKNG